MRSGAIQPLLLIILGLLWFLKSTALLPETTTLLALLLTAAGALLLMMDGLTKSTLVSSPMLVYAGMAVYLFDEDKMRLSHVMSLGMMLLGVLLLLARSPRIPDRRPSRPARGDQANDSR